MGRAALVLLLLFPSSFSAAGLLQARCSDAAADSLTVSWTAAPEFKLYYVQLSHTGSSAGLAQPFALQTAQSGPLRFSGLALGTSYTVSIRALPLESPSEAWGPAWTEPASPVECRTSQHWSAASSPGAGEVPSPAAHSEQAGSGSRYLRAYRVSEYAFDVDFLRNHDAASVEAMPLYLMTCDTEGTCSPWDAKKQSPKWDECHAAMLELCPNSRGTAFNCMACAEANHADLTAACGNWTLQDSLEGAGTFAIHWWCGVGWPESAAVQGPITEYCVEYQPLEEEAADDGFSGYLSCNSDEVDGTLGNDPRDPSCLCIVYDDRLLAHQTNETLKLDCYQGGMAWLQETRCNCPGQSVKSPVPHPGNPSVTHVGRMPVWLPYVGVKMSPWHPGNPQVASGYNYHFPKAGACGEGEALGTRGCTWRRLPQARMIYGADLLAQGWNSTFVADTATDQSHTRRNVAVFKAAFDALGNIVKPTPCEDGLVGASLVI